jgi:hypothetical protein
MLMIVSLAPAGALAQATRPLPPFYVNISQSSVLGLSAGGDMAMQLLRSRDQTTVTPVYSCVRFGCSGTRTTDVPDLVRITDQNATQGLFDATLSLRNGRFWLFSGTAKAVVPQRTRNDPKTYLPRYVDSCNIFYKNDLAAQHAEPN